MARAQRHYIVIKKNNGHKALLPDLINALPYLTGFGSKTFIEEMKDALGFRATGRKILCDDNTFELRKTITAYGKDSDLDSGNTFLWK